MNEAYQINSEGFFIKPIPLENNQILMMELVEEITEIIGQDGEGNDILENKIIKKSVPRMDVIYPVYLGNENVHVAELPDGLFKPQFDFVLGEWKNGLTDEEIEALKNQPTKPDDIELLKQENEILKNAQAETNTTLLEFMEAVLIGGM